MSVTARNERPMDFLRSAALLALGGLAAAAGVRGARQHRVLGRHPAFALAAQPRRQPLFHAGGDEHARIAERYEARPFGVLGEAGLDIDGAHFIRRAAGRSHKNLQWRTQDPSALSLSKRRS
jgi:hypothetical protein